MAGPPASRWQNWAATGTFRPVGGGQRGRSRGRTGHLRRARTSTDRESGIAYGARALRRRSPRSSPRAGKPSTWRRGAGDSASPGAGGTRDAGRRNVLAIIRDRGRQGTAAGGRLSTTVQPGPVPARLRADLPERRCADPGVTAETVDGMSLAKIEGIIERSAPERYRWTPVRRVYIEKKGSTKQRPLGIPTWSDKLLQEVIRFILEAYYEPQFSPPLPRLPPRTRVPHRALRRSNDDGAARPGSSKGTSRDASTASTTSPAGDPPREDPRQPLPAADREPAQGGIPGGLEVRPHLSGTPQGGVVSPILANIYLDRLDQYVEQVLFPEYNREPRGSRTRHTAAYGRASRRTGIPHARGGRSPAQADAANPFGRCRTTRTTGACGTSAMPTTSCWGSSGHGRRPRRSSDGSASSCATSSSWNCPGRRP